MDIDSLKDLGFQIQAQQERAVLPLSEDGLLCFEVRTDEQLRLVANGAEIELNTEDLNIDNIIESFKVLFNGNKLEPPF